jgi:hypothetical protein
MASLALSNNEFLLYFSAHDLLVGLHLRDVKVG